jgi:rRNA-processing protein EBP2
LNADDNDFDIELMKEEEEPQKKKQKTGPKKNKTREVKDKKFGFGGKKRHLKTNTSESTNDFSFNPHKNKAPFGAMKSKAKPQRPGKSKRVARKFK